MSCRSSSFWPTLLSWEPVGPNRSPSFGSHGLNDSGCFDSDGCKKMNISNQGQGGVQMSSQAQNVQQQQNVANVVQQNGGTSQQQQANHVQSQQSSQQQNSVPPPQNVQTEQLSSQQQNAIPPTTSSLGTVQQQQITTSQYSQQHRNQNQGNLNQANQQGCQPQYIFQDQQVQQQTQMTLGPYAGQQPPQQQNQQQKGGQQNQQQAGQQQAQQQPPPQQTITPTPPQQTVTPNPPQQTVTPTPPHQGQQIIQPTLPAQQQQPPHQAPHQQQPNHQQQQHAQPNQQQPNQQQPQQELVLSQVSPTHQGLQQQPPLQQPAQQQPVQPAGYYHNSMASSSPRPPGSQQVNQQSNQSNQNQNQQAQSQAGGAKTSSSPASTPPMGYATVHPNVPPLQNFVPPIVANNQTPTTQTPTNETPTNLQAQMNQQQAQQHTIQVTAQQVTAQGNQHQQQGNQHQQKVVVSQPPMPKQHPQIPAPTQQAQMTAPTTHQTQMPQQQQQQGGQNQQPSNQLQQNQCYNPVGYHPVVPIQNALGPLPPGTGPNCGTPSHGPAPIQNQSQNQNQCQQNNNANSQTSQSQQQNLSASTVSSTTQIANNYLMNSSTTQGTISVPKEWVALANTFYLQNHLAPPEHNFRRFAVEHSNKRRLFRCSMSDSPEDISETIKSAFGINHLFSRQVRIRLLIPQSRETLCSLRPEGLAENETYHLLIYDYPPDTTTALRSEDNPERGGYAGNNTSIAAYTSYHGGSTIARNANPPNGGDKRGGVEKGGSRSVVRQDSGRVRGTSSSNVVAMVEQVRDNRENRDNRKDRDRSDYRGDYYYESRKEYKERDQDNRDQDKRDKRDRDQDRDEPKIKDPPASYYNSNAMQNSLIAAITKNEYIPSVPQKKGDGSGEFEKVHTKDTIATNAAANPGNIGLVYDKNDRNDRNDRNNQKDTAVPGGMIPPPLQKDNNNIGDEDKNSDMEIERSPNGRFVRYKQEPRGGSGSYDWSYLGYDSDSGRQVCWNILSFIPSNFSFHKMESLPESDCVIRQIHAFEQSGQFIVITDRGSSHTVRTHISRLPKDHVLKLGVVRKWTRDLAEGIQTFATHFKQHGAVVIDNIFVKRNTGNVILGDPFLGKTPKSNAEVILSKTTRERQDIVGFGLCLLDIIFKNTRLEIKKVCDGAIPPEVGKIKHTTLRELVHRCFSAPDSRALYSTGTTSMLQHPFLQEEDDGAYCEVEK